MNRFARLTAACAFLLLVAGGLVTSTGSSLSVPDWPLSFGRAFPAMKGGVLFEHGHRMIAGVVSLLTFALAFRVRSAEKRGWVRGLAYAAAGGIVLQALLGGATVLLRLPPPVSISHACLGQAVFCLILGVAQATDPSFERWPSRSVESGLWKTGALAVCAVYVQLAFGAYLRHVGAGLWLHVAWAGTAVAALARVFWSSRDARLIGLGRGLAVLVPLQLALGYASYRLKFSLDFELGVHPAAFVTAAHLAVGAAILGTTVLWTLRARRLAA